MLTSCALSIKFHIILVIVLMTIKIFYTSIIFYKLLPMFMIHVLFINIILSLFTCFMPAYSKEVDTGKNCMYLRVISLYETVISIRVLLYDPNGSMSSTQIGPTIFVCCSNCIPNMHAHLSFYLVISRQSVLLCFSTYLMYMNNYCYCDAPKPGGPLTTLQPAEYP